MKIKTPPGWCRVGFFYGLAGDRNDSVGADIKKPGSTIAGLNVDLGDAD